MGVVVTEVPPVLENTTLASIAEEASTVMSNITAQLITTLATNASENESSTVISPGWNATDSLKLPEDDDDVHRNPELKYFSTVIIIFMGLTILIVPVFCFIGVVCARSKFFTTFREVAGRGWGFRDLNVPYSEFGSDDYPKDGSKSDGASSSSASRNCDVKILVADDNRVPSSRSNRRSSLLRINASDEDEDISSLPPTFVHRPTPT